MRNKNYNESQSFWTWWLIALFVILFFSQIFPIGAAKGEIENSTLVGVGLLLVIFILFFFMRLHTQIDENGITIQFLPFVRRKTWNWDSIDHVFIKEYSILDYGGWGYRIGKSGTAYNTKGKYGVQLILKNGAKIMIGTQQPEAIMEVIKEYSNIK